MKVSVIITSYNHTDTIGRAIESVLSQKTNFDFHVVIVDDGSTDNSVNTIRQYYENSDKIGVIEFDRNLGIMQAYKAGFEYCQGEYITFCECDDYWAANSKLQKQIDYMDANPDCGFCTHRVLTSRNNTIIDNSLPSSEVNNVVSFDNLLRGNAYIYAQSYCIRKSVFDKWINFDMFTKRFNVWDYPIVLELIKRTRFHQLDFYGAFFVIRGESITNTNNRLKRLKLILGYAKIRTYYVLKYGCEPTTLVYLIYRFMRDLISVILKRWIKN